MWTKLLSQKVITTTTILKFQTKDLEHLRYFLGIEVAQSKDGLVISQRNYAPVILEETRMIKAKHVDIPMDPSV